MSQMDYLTLMIGSLVIIGVLFAFQYKMATNEKRWKIFVLPALMLLLYLFTSTGVMVYGNQYSVEELSGVDRFGNNLELTIREPKSGSGYAAAFSMLQVYDENHILLDEIRLLYEDNVGIELSPNKAYHTDVSEMLQGIKLNGKSQALSLVREEIGFFGVTLPQNTYSYFAVPFGIAILLLLCVGLISRGLQTRAIRRRSMDHVDIQSVGSL